MFVDLPRIARWVVGYSGLIWLDVVLARLLRLLLAEGCPRLDHRYGSLPVTYVGAVTR